MTRPSISASLIAGCFVAAVAAAVLFPVLGSPVSFLVGAVFGAATFLMHRGFDSLSHLRPARRSWAMPPMPEPVQFRRGDGP